MAVATDNDAQHLLSVGPLRAVRGARRRSRLRPRCARSRGVAPMTAMTGSGESVNVSRMRASSTLARPGWSAARRRTTASMSTMSAISAQIISVKHRREPSVHARPAHSAGAPASSVMPCRARPSLMNSASSSLEKAFSSQRRARYRGLPRRVNPAGSPVNQSDAVLIEYQVGGWLVVGRVPRSQLMLGSTVQRAIVDPVR